MKLEDAKNGASNAEKASGNLTEVTFEEAFEMTGHGKFNNLVLLMCGLILFNVTMESIGPSYVVTAAQCDLGLTSQHKGLITAAAFIGIVSTSFLWGYLGDRYGRRKVMLPSLLISSALSLASSFSINVWMLFFLRLFTGFFLSASSATVYAYLSEMHISSKRGSTIVWGSSFIAITFVILPGLAWVIIPGTWSLQILSVVVRPWQTMIWFWCLPGLLAAGILAVLPESPRFVQTKSPDKALPILASMYAWNTGDDASNFQVKSLSHADMQSSGFSAAIKNIGYLFRPPLLRAVLVSFISMFSVFLLSSGVYLWVPDILNSILVNKNSGSMSICDIISNNFQEKRNASLHQGLNSSLSSCETNISTAVFSISMGMGVFFMVIYLLIGVVINVIGRVRLYCIIMALSGILTAASGLVPSGTIATVMLVVALGSGCAASILAAIVVEVIPTSMRAMAMCVMYMVGRLGAAVGSNILGATLDTHCQLAFISFGAFVVAAVLLLIWWPNSDRVRKSMENKGFSY